MIPKNVRPKIMSTPVSLKVIVCLKILRLYWVILTRLGLLIVRRCYPLKT